MTAHRSRGTDPLFL